MSRKGLLALEAIAFQDKAFFTDLTAAVQAVMDMPSNWQPSKLRLEQFYASKEMLNICTVVKKHTNIALEYVGAGSNAGPAIGTSVLTKNHIFHNYRMKNRLLNVETLQPPDLAAAMKEGMLAGTVDMANNKVTGIFSELNNCLLIPAYWFYLSKSNPVYLNADEIAAVLLHEVGHAFTNLEFLGRSFSTNQVLAGVSRALSSNDARIKEVVFSTASSLEKLTPEQTAALKACENEKEAAVILLSAAVLNSRSSLGDSVYDSVSCEQLADQYAARCGAAKALIFALDKTNLGGLRKARSTYDALVILTFVVSTFGLGFLALLMFSSNNYGYVATYDNYASRIRRVKHELIEQLKDTELSREQKQTIVEEIAMVDKLEKLGNDNLSWMDTFSYFTNPVFRSRHNFQELQKELEKLAHNNLFVKAAQLSTL